MSCQRCGYRPTVGCCPICHKEICYRCIPMEAIGNWGTFYCKACYNDNVLEKCHICGVRDTTADKCICCQKRTCHNCLDKWHYCNECYTREKPCDVCGKSTNRNLCMTQYCGNYACHRRLLKEEFHDEKYCKSCRKVLRKKFRCSVYGCNKITMVKCDGCGQLVCNKHLYFDDGDRKCKRCWEKDLESKRIHEEYEEYESSSRHHCVSCGERTWNKCACGLSWICKSCQQHHYDYKCPVCKNL